MPNLIDAKTAAKITEAAELYLGKGFLGVTISWSDAS